MAGTCTTARSSCSAHSAARRCCRRVTTMQNHTCSHRVTTALATIQPPCTRNTESIGELLLQAHSLTRPATLWFLKAADEATPLSASLRLDYAAALSPTASPGATSGRLAGCERLAIGRSHEGLLCSFASCAADEWTMLVDAAALPCHEPAALAALGALRDATVERVSLSDADGGADALLAMPRPPTFGGLVRAPAGGRSLNSVCVCSAGLTSRLTRVRCHGSCCRTAGRTRAGSTSLRSTLRCCSRLASRSVSPTTEAPSGGGAHTTRCCSVTPASWTSPTSPRSPGDADGGHTDLEYSSRSAKWTERRRAHSVPGSRALELQPGRLDPSRCALWGGSHGGFLTAWLLGHPAHSSLYACGVLWNPVVDLPAMLGTTDIPEWVVAEALGDVTLRWPLTAAQMARVRGDRSFRWCPSARFTDDGGHFSRDFAQVYERSPITVVDRVRVPALVLLGACDLRVPPSQGRAWVAARQELGGVDGGHFRGPHPMRVLTRGGRTRLSQVWSRRSSSQGRATRSRRRQSLPTRCSRRSASSRRRWIRRWDQS